MENDKRVLRDAAIVMIFVVLAVYFSLFFIAIPEANKGYVDAGLTLMRDLALALVFYYWGTSKGSGDKSDTIDRLLNNKAK